MFEFARQIFVGAVAGIFGAKTQQKIEEAADPTPDGPSERQLLVEIRDALRSDDPQSRRAEGANTQIDTAITLQKPPLWTTVWKHGRRHMRLLTSEQLSIVVQSGAGQYDLTLAPGQWHQLDLADGTAIALHPDDAASQRTVTMRLDGR